MKKELRYYQKETVQAIIEAWNCKDEKKIPYVSVMTGLGKSLIMADLTDKAQDRNKRVLQLVPKKELVEQNYIECVEYVKDKSSIGICCGQLNKHQVNKKTVIAMASSFVSRRATSGAFDIVIIDEADLVKTDEEGQKPSTYNKILKSLYKLNPQMLVCGLTGTPWRTDSGGELHDESYKGKPFFTHKVFDTFEYPGISRLIEESFLSDVKTLNTSVSIDLDGVRKSGKDLNTEDVGIKFEKICEEATIDIQEKFIDNNISTALIFTSNQKNAQMIYDLWTNKSEIKIVNDKTTSSDRAKTVNWIKNGSGNRYVLNVNLYCRGFDYRSLQCCVLVRATISPSLLCQMIGRILRPCDTKDTGYLLDYGSNCERLGSITSIIIPKIKKKKGDAPKKICNSILNESLIDKEGFSHHINTLCNTENIMSAKFCSLCNAKFISVDDTGKYKMLSQSSILAEKEARSVTKYDTPNVSFEIAHSRKTANKMIKMLLMDDEFNTIHKHYLCLDHSGFAQQHSKRFLLSMFKNKKDYYKLGTVGLSVENVFKLFDSNYDAFFKTIIAADIRPQPGGRYNEIKNVYFDV